MNTIAEKGVRLVKLKRWPSLARFLSGKLVRIWSEEWLAWWRPDGAGYTSDLAGAGIYTFEDAFNRSSHCDPSKGICYVPAQEEYTI